MSKIFTNIKQLKDIFKGKDCVILTCGPSLREYSDEKIRKFCRDKVIICIKETIIEYGDIANFHIYNGTRIRKYNVSNKKYTSIFQLKKENIKTINQYNNIIDINIYEDIPFKKTNQLLRKKNFNEYNFKNKIKRPWGPGILYETVFYLCLYMGIINVYTIGWDLIDTKKETKIIHYFEYDDKYKESEKWNNRNFRDEMLLVNNNIKYMYNYFKNNNMNIFIVGKKSYVDKIIPRITL